MVVPGNTSPALQFPAAVPSHRDDGEPAGWSLPPDSDEDIGRGRDGEEDIEEEVRPPPDPTAAANLATAAAYLGTAKP